jgi:hypothetical protein
MAAAQRAKKLAKKASKAMRRQMPNSDPALSMTTSTPATTAAIDREAQEYDKAK